MLGNSPEPLLLIIPVSLSHFGPDPVLMIRKVIRDQESIRMLARQLLKHGYIDVRARLVVADPFKFYVRLQELLGE